MSPMHIRFLGLVIIAISLVFSWFFVKPVTFSINPTVWFTPAYYIQFIPLYISGSLLFCGVFVFARLSGINFYLAVFGHAASEEILFSLIGLTTTPLPNYASVVLFPLSLLALWAAYTNVLRKKRVSLAEGVFGFVCSTAFILLPRFM